MGRVAVVGGGLSGLAAAWAAAQGGAGEVLVLEREERPGGKVLTHREGPWRAELGPTAYLGGEAAVAALVADLGLGREDLAAWPAAARRYVLLGGRPREIPLHPLRFLTAGVLTLPGLLRLLGEPFVRPRRDEEEESVWDFAARRLGAQAAARLVAPMVLGIFAGDARRLSLPAAFPRLAALEEAYGSLLKGLLRRRGRGGGGPGGPAGTLRSFRGGLGVLPARLAAAPGIRFRGGAEVVALRAGQPGAWRLRLADGEELAADSVVLAAEAHALAALLEPLAPAAARALGEIPSPPLAVVALGYGVDAVCGVPRGFGVLVPREEGYRLLGVLSESCLFPDRAPPRHRLLKVLYGGAVDPEAARAAPGDILALARRELRELFAVRAAPVFAQVRIWPRAIPQYELGHPERRCRIETALAAHPGLFLAGTALNGVGCTKALLTGLGAGQAAAAFLRQRC